MNNKIARLIRKQIKLDKQNKDKYELIQHEKKMYITKIDGTKELITINRGQIINPVKQSYRKIKKMYKNRGKK